MDLYEATAYANDLFASVSMYLNTIIIALAIILIGFIIGKVVEKLLRKLFSVIDLDERFTRAFKAKRNYARAIRRTIVRLIYVAAVLFALEYLSVMREMLVILLGMAILTLLVSAILSGIEVFPNLSGRIELSRRRISPGDEIVFTDPTGTIQGVVADVTLTDVRIKRENGDYFIVPNALFINSRVIRKKTPSASRGASAHP